MSCDHVSSREVLEVSVHVGRHFRSQRLVFGRRDEQAGSLDLLDGQSGGVSLRRCRAVNLHLVVLPIDLSGAIPIHCSVRWVSTVD